jgi:predicted dinucleotide-binding enzyme
VCRRLQIIGAGTLGQAGGRSFRNANHETTLVGKTIRLTQAHPEVATKWGKLR